MSDPYVLDASTFEEFNQPGAGIASAKVAAPKSLIAGLGGKSTTTLLMLLAGTAVLLIALPDGSRRR